MAEDSANIDHDLAKHTKVDQTDVKSLPASGLTLSRSKKPGLYDFGFEATGVCVVHSASASKQDIAIRKRYAGMRKRRGKK